MIVGKRGGRRKRYQRIVLAYVRVLGPELASVNVRKLLPAVFAAVPDTNTREIADAIQWAIRESNRSGARFERRMFGHPRPRRRRPRLRLVPMIDAVLMVLVLGVLLLAVGVDLAFVAAWALRRW